MDKNFKISPNDGGITNLRDLIENSNFLIIGTEKSLNKRAQQKKK